MKTFFPDVVFNKSDTCYINKCSLFVTLFGDIGDSLLNTESTYVFYSIYAEQTIVPFSFEAENAKSCATCNMNKASKFKPLVMKTYNFVLVEGSIASNLCYGFQTLYQRCRTLGTFSQVHIMCHLLAESNMVRFESTPHRWNALNSIHTYVVKETEFNDR